MTPSQDPYIRYSQKATGSASHILPTRSKPPIRRTWLYYYRSVPLSPEITIICLKTISRIVEDAFAVNIIPTTMSYGAEERQRDSQLTSDAPVQKIAGTGTRAYSRCTPARSAHMYIPLYQAAPQSPSSIPTFRHQGWRPLASLRLPPALTASSTSPTCLRSLTSLPAFNFSLIALCAIVKPALRSNPLRASIFSFPPPLPSDSLDCLPTGRVNPGDERESAVPPAAASAGVFVIHSSLMTGRCHCSGSDDEDRRLRWR